MRPTFTFSDEVRVVRAIRNDGTVAGFAPGALLVRRGSTGFVRDWGVFLQDQIIYQIHFPQSGRIIGCREQELIPVSQPWLAGNLQYGDTVICQMALAVNGNVVVTAGQQGRIEATDQGERGDSYTVDFSGRWFTVPLQAISLVEERES
ncbi:nitrogen fixation protein NifZ [Raoultella ornithinolytica]|uniref:nitrogen fixation protein NifZ n=1 Tax=Raoultella ornithinolytica TaxID=54291 RepID=UPI0005CA0A6A|nr:nitrogen fixation protein NifZ [Raoultella ornithinolytica]EKX4893209.1 nitrogen fixation protein NifZ [Raoultella ornithinolytica]KIZ46129.1 protein NifZ [Raoultella ornithinolytica]MCF1305767.1 nitrogen fixation protein NifZ [Raoultella ornithinolytica]VTM88453.1 NifZ domain [Raoultella ornithinolytica]